MERQKAGLPAVAVQLPIIAQGGYAADGNETKAVSLTSNKCTMKLLCKEIGRCLLRAFVWLR